MYKIFYISIIWMFIVIPASSQEIDSAGLISREKSMVIVNKLFNNNSSNYLLFSISDKWYLIIKDCGNYYMEYFVSTNPFKSNESSTKPLKIHKPNKVLNNAFNNQVYRKNYINFSSPFFKGQELYSEGNMTYFFFSNKGHKFGESRLSVFITPNPINEKIYSYLRMRILKFIQE